uniref:Rosy n=1 Tax=Mesovelia mulsanti TaxID=236398 RepID=A0A5C1YS49_9HEMI|nr:rosy [Mesovelia mulsanti]
MISKYDRSSKKIIHFSANACLTPVCSVHGLAITTVEGIGSTKTKIHAVQERIAKSHGSQCGFCTPGIVMSMYTLLRSKPGKPTMHDLEVAFQGNLCRCTGYRPIIDGFKTFTEEWEQSQRLSQMSNGVCGKGKDCCKYNGGASETEMNGHNGNESPVYGCNGFNGNEEARLVNPSEFSPYDSSQEPIFPPELMMSHEYDNTDLKIQGRSVTWYRPTSLKTLLNLKKTYPSAKIINGNTEIGVEVKFKNCSYPILINPSKIKELTSVQVVGNGVKIGAAVTLTDMETFLKKQIDQFGATKTRIFQEIVEMLHWFAGKQIRNVGTVGGNIMTGSPISDLNPIFMVAECTLNLIKEGGSRTVKMDGNFWTGYRQNIVAQNEILQSIFIPFTKEGQYFKAYKQAKRRDDDIAIVNSAFNVILSGTKISSVIIAYGGMAPTTLLLKKTPALLKGREWSHDLMKDALPSLLEELPLNPSAPGGMIQYRRSLTLSMFYKFFLEVVNSLQDKGIKAIVPENFTSGSRTFRTLTPSGSQYFTLVPGDQEKHDMVGRPMVHQSAYKQATGEAIYLDDMPTVEHELYLSFVLSTRPHAKILSIDTTNALADSKVVAFFSSCDLSPEQNFIGPIIHDDPVFADGKVLCNGQIIGAIVAKDQATAQKASKLVKIKYEDIKPVIITIDEAINAKSFFRSTPKTIKRGNSEEALKSAQHLLTGEIRVGGQEHFYLETHAALAIPKKEDNEIDVYSSSQHPSELQHHIAHVLGIDANRVVCKVKRLGGGFGGKESRSAVIAVPVAFAAHKLQKPVRVMLDRDEDMIITGQRHPFYGKYTVGFDSTGKITACEISIYSNGGCTFDLSESVMERCMFHFENALHIENVTVYGYVCKTNLPSNTAFRGFGGPQGMLMGEVMARHIAKTLGKDYVEIIEKNMYKEGDFTNFNQQLNHCTMDRCWSECIRNAHFYERRIQVAKFNEEHRWRKRGISIVPTKFGISFTTTFLNQAGALVLVYQDGSVLISHGGTEMGQGLHTKMIQVASRALGIPADHIHISDTSTDKVPNSSATAASAGSDLNGMAVLNACNIINERLQPIKEKNPTGTWADWARTAYLTRVSLAASGFYSTPDIGYDPKKYVGNAFNYFTYGAACSEVEVDCLTGDHQVIRTDIVMDLGESLNPAIDIGQIEGAFVQGYGLFTIEDPVFSPTGVLYSRGPGAYKIPGFSDIPAQFNVSLLKGAPNPRAVYSSKAVGEPPLFLASSVFFAIREAVEAARKDAGHDEWFSFDSPATAASIRMACIDNITEMISAPEKGTFTPWNVQV